MTRKLSDFEIDFAHWLQRAMADPAPGDVAAFCFNLFEPSDAPEKFAVELVGARAFDPGDNDWACDEAWWPSPRWIPIATDWSDEDWSVCLDRTVGLVKRLISEDRRELSQLVSREAVAVGFVGGDLEIVWQNN